MNLMSTNMKENFSLFKSIIFVVKSLELLDPVIGRLHNMPPQSHL